MASIPEGESFTVEVALTNAGAATWPSAGTNPVVLSYHWYTAAGLVATWDGVRTPLSADVEPGAETTVSARVIAPARAGDYQLHFALVREGLAWFESEPTAHRVKVLGSFTSDFGEISVSPMSAGSIATIAVPVTNTGLAAWSSAVNAVHLSYHWYDVFGRVAVWDGRRTAIETEFAPGETRTLSATVAAPFTAGSYTLAFELLREGVAWFGTTSTRLPVSVGPTPYRASYGVSATAVAMMSGAESVPVKVTNTGAAVWEATGDNPVALSYHWYDEAGRVVVWDGLRTTLPADVPAGASLDVSMRLAPPPGPGHYRLRVDLVREGVAWFSWLGTPSVSVAFPLLGGWFARYGSDNLPGSVSQGTDLPIRVTITNVGHITWPAGGANPVALSYHVYGAGGALVTWDGLRGALPRDVYPGEEVSVDLTVRAPNAPGSYALKWDVVHEGVAWFSSLGVAPRARTLAVTSGVTFYGKGFGHGVGLSQWGAQGWATGAVGVTLSGEEIVKKYYPGAEISPIDGMLPHGVFRVLLSSPSTGCIGRSIYGYSRMRSDGGLAVARFASQSAPFLRMGPGAAVRVWTSGGLLRVLDERTGRVVYAGTDAVAVLPLDASRPIWIDQKARAYRGKLVFEQVGWSMRVVNHVGVDEYVRGAVPVEMFRGWHVEAYKAQAYAARTYATAKQRAYAARSWDIYDDTKDQCYGGASAETAPTDLATAATAGKILTYAGAPIVAYYAASHGGSVEGNGCVWNLRLVNGSYQCGESYPYLMYVDDPADMAARDAFRQNPNNWSVTFSAAAIRSAVLRMSGFDIGVLHRVDLSNTSPSGRPIAVRVYGSRGMKELRADTFLRSYLRLRSTNVRLTPW